MTSLATVRAHLLRVPPGKFSLATMHWKARCLKPSRAILRIGLVSASCGGSQDLNDLKDLTPFAEAIVELRARRGAPLASNLLVP